MRLGDDREPRRETADGAQLIGPEPGEVILNVLGPFTREAPCESAEPPWVHHVDDVVDRRRAVRTQLDEHPERELHVALGGALVMRLGESLGRDQLVLQLGRVAVLQRIPARRAVGRPDGKRPTRGPGGELEPAGELGGAFHVDRDDRPPAQDVLGEEREHRRRLAGATGPDDQPVGGQLLLGEHHRLPATVGAEQDAVGLAADRPLARAPGEQPAPHRDPKRRSHPRGEGTDRRPAEPGRGDRERDQRREQPPTWRTVVVGSPAGLRRPGALPRPRGPRHPRRRTKLAPLDVDE